MYCEEGFGAIDCPLGTYNDDWGAETLDDCLPCPVGYFCNMLGATMADLVLAGGASYGQCSAGYVCFEGSTTPTPNDNIMGMQC